MDTVTDTVRKKSDRVRHYGAELYQLGIIGPKRRPHPIPRRLFRACSQV